MINFASPIRFDPKQEMSHQLLELHYNLDLETPHVEFHAHPFYEIYFFLEGNLQSYVVGGCSHQLRSGDILMMPPGVPHHPIFLPESGPYRRYVLWISQEQVRRLGEVDPGLLAVFDMCSREETYRIRCSSTAVRDQLENILSGMWMEERGNAACKTAYLNSLCMGFLVLLNRVITDEHALMPRHFQSSNLLEEIIAYVNKNYASPISLKQMADMFFTSPSNIEQLFSNKLGKPFYLYVTECRIIHAQALISGGMAMKEVAHACGYNDYSNFYRAFIREMGISPTEFRNMVPPAHFQAGFAPGENRERGHLLLRNQTGKEKKQSHPESDDKTASRGSLINRNAQGTRKGRASGG